MKFVLLTGSFLLISMSYVFCQNINQDINRIEPWLGKWQGSMVMYSATKEPTTIPIALHHFTTDTIGTYGWYIIYGKDEEKGKRPYFLKTIDSKSGHYQIDEKNSIFLDAYLIKDRIISDFEVEKSTITSVYTLVNDDHITVEFFAGNKKEPHITGGQNEIPLVYSYEIGQYHRAELTRVNEQDK